MNESILNDVRRLRRDNPTMSMKHALSWARGNANVAIERELWEDRSSAEGWECEREGFTLHLSWTVESTGPACGSKGESEYGKYVSPARYWDNYAPQPYPAEPTPMGLPAALFHYSTRYDNGFFFPGDVEEEYDYYRRSGMAKQPARERLSRWVATRVRELVGGHTDWDDAGIENGYLRVEAYREGIELGQSGIGAEIISETYNEAADQVFALLLDHDLATSAIEHAEATLAVLCRSKEENA